ncbi:MAG: PAN domain-containing protein [Bradyrhizobium sp.]
MRRLFPSIVMLVLLWTSGALADDENPADISTPRENLARLAKDPAAQGNPERCDISLVGKIGKGTAKAFKKIFGSEDTTNEFNSHTVTLCLDSTGGLASEALEIARFIVTQHADAISTVVQNGAVCQSACALVFLAGREKSRLGPSVGRYLHPYGKLKFHPTYLQTEKEKDEAENTVDLYLKKEGTRDQVLAQYYSSGLRDVRQIIQTYGDMTWFADYIGKPFASASLFLEVFSQAPDEWLCMDSIDKVGRWGIRLVGYERTLLPKQKYYNVCRNAYIWGHDENAVDSWRSNVPGKVAASSPKTKIAGRNNELDNGFEHRYIVDVDFTVKASKCVVEEKNWGTYSTFKAYFLDPNGGLVSGIYETADAGLFSPATPIAELGKLQVRSTKESAPPKLNPAFPRFAKRQDRGMACELRRLETADIDSCEAYCTNNSECFGFSYNRSAKVCSLKHTASALRFDPLWETGIKPGIPIPKDSIKTVTMDSSPFNDAGYVLQGKLLDKSAKENLDSCAVSCLADQVCRGVTFSTASSQCYRFERIDKVSKETTDQLRDRSGAVEYSEIAVKRQK